MTQFNTIIISKRKNDKPWGNIWELWEHMIMLGNEEQFGLSFFYFMLSKGNGTMA